MARRAVILLFRTRTALLGNGVCTLLAFCFSLVRVLEQGGNSGQEAVRVAVPTHRRTGISVLSPDAKRLFFCSTGVFHAWWLPDSFPCDGFSTGRKSRISRKWEGVETGPARRMVF